MNNRQLQGTQNYKTVENRALRLAAAALLAAVGVGASAQQVAQRARDITDLSLEQLSSIEVTSVAKRLQRLQDVAGSVYIISQEDIRRAGVTSIPEALRLAPNLTVARADANQHAITARGFNSVLANTRLVLIDGRTVYSPLFSGVFWEAQDLLMEDIERIEVLSGAGGTLYGSNAVNGVINIITRAPADAQGVLAKAAAGSEERLLGARYGGEAGPFHYRVYAKRVLRENTELTSGAPVRDAMQRTQAGFRADSLRGTSNFTVQGDIYDSRVDQAPAPRQVSGWNLLGRYVRDMGSAGRAQLQAYVDRTERDQPGAIHDRLLTWDLDFQHQLQPRDGHELVWGAGWRLQDDHLTNLAPALFEFLPPNRKHRLWNVFVQDEVALRDKLRFTLGLKAEHNDVTGTEFLPNARLAWEFAPNTLLWAAASRAVRAPSRVDRDFFSPAVRGGPDFESEVAKVYELGLRAQPLPSVSWSVALFHHRFDKLRSLDATPLGATINNNFEARLDGLESWGYWRVNERWRLEAGYAWQRLRANAMPGTAPLVGVSSLGNDPRYRITFASSWDISRNHELDVHLRRVGALPQPAVPAYTALDVRWGWRARPDLELSLVVRNLLDGRHPEWGAPASRVEFDRSLLLKAVWRM